MANLLIVDDEIVLCKNIARYLSSCGHQTDMAHDGASATEAFDRLRPDMVILDYRLPDCSGIELIRKFREQDAQVPILMITGHGSIELAVEAMQAGANDLLTKPTALPELRARVDHFLHRQRAESRLRYYEQKDRVQAPQIIGDSEAIRKLRERIARIADVVGESTPPILISGETGVGKELVARSLHYGGAFAERPFVELNCASIPENLLESELFGYEKGAFTGAVDRKIGLLESADGGTLFLDEIGEMQLGLQAKLLKVLEDGRFRRLGSVQERQVQLRIIAATHQDLPKRIEEGRFRADLYFRLRVLQIDVPPLRERSTDILQLAYNFIDTFSLRYQRVPLGLSRDAENALLAHRWPGNVRELRNVIEQAVLLATGKEIGPGDLMVPGVIVAAVADMQISHSRIDQAERELIVEALARAAGNVSQAARDLGISRDTLRYRLDKHGIKAG